MRGSYHGKSMGALSLTFNPKYRKSFAPLVDEVEFIPFGDKDALQNAVNDKTAMVIMEPIQGESGIHVAPDGFLQKARSVCDENGALLVFDEIQCGLGRTGRMWACDHWDTKPDILCTAKGIAGGVPMGATLAKPEIIASISKGEQKTIRCHMNSTLSLDWLHYHHGSLVVYGILQCIFIAKRNKLYLID